MSNPETHRTIAVSFEDASNETAQTLLTEMCAELSLRYGIPPSPFSGSDAAAFVVARLAGEPVGCGALRPLDANTAEVKRMFVRPAGRRRGIARQILAKLEQRAAELGFTTVRLETGREQPEAIALYESSGYQRIPAFGGYVGNPNSVCFEKPLR